VANVFPHKAEPFCAIGTGGPILVVQHGGGKFISPQGGAELSSATGTGQYFLD